jgi:tRNA G18 (ribose-2'-O)-methylase SpoU
VKKTSLSAEGNIDWKYYISGMHAVSDLKELGVKIISLERSESSLDISELTPESLVDQPLCLVLGNEVSGVSEEILAASDMICHIPMRGMKESLNVSVAFGVAAFSISNLLRKS